MTKVSTLFQKPVNRHIEGVIKADDEAGLLTEVEEFVMTDEIGKRLDAFLDAYNNYEGANGVWISGFFGSGKSHLLKMLALVLENRTVDDTPVLDLFVAKAQDEILRGNLKKAASIPSKSILFNIDQKADIISKTQVDALIAVFVKVFDEACGYYGKQPYIAQFERELDHDGLFDEFKEAFQRHAGKDWEWGRARSARVGADVDAAYKDVTGKPAKDVLDKFRSDYRLSIEDFAQQVNEYIESHGKDFRLNFFVDEAGQYIADNTKLMTNLQTIAESLNTKSRGRAWIIVTAQEDMHSVIGEMTRQQSNDFSKIQARFQTRMKLTSANVEDVICRRLLLKNDQGIEVLSKIYHEQQNNFKTLFNFVDGAQHYRNYTDRDHFIKSYPFVPYQFVLFQSAIQNLSQHNAFEGKHSSVGERSMLGVFQQVAVGILDHEVGQLATFDLMFEGLRTALRAESQRAVQLAEQHLDNPFAVRVLKALFLVKYIKEFRPTVRNLCVLMCDSFEQDLAALRKEVEEAVNILEQQNYVQRNGEQYEYLTSEEKDVEAEVKAMEVETSVVAEELAKIIFDEVIKDRKIRLPDSGQDYVFTRKLDDRAHGREHELAIHAVSPFHEHAENEELLGMQSMGKNELLVIMPPDSRLLSDMLLYKKTEKYIAQNTTSAQRQSIKNILISKGTQNQERRAEIKQRVRDLLGRASMYASGTKLDIGGEDAVNRICKGFAELVSVTYPNLRMLRGVQYKEEQIPVLLNDPQGTLPGGDPATLPEPQREMLSVIQSNSRGGVRTTLKSLIEKFERKPYGWDYAATLCILAQLCACGKIEARSDGNIVENNELAQALRNTVRHANVILDPQVEFTASQIRALKEFFEDFFDAPPHATEAKALGREFTDTLKTRIEELRRIAEHKSSYPFLVKLDQAIETLQEIAGKPYTWHLTELMQQKEDLLDLKEDVLDPITRFMAGSQKEVYDRARTLLAEQQPNFDYLDGEDATSIKTILHDPDALKGSQIQQLKTLRNELEAKITQAVQAESASAVQKIQSMQQRMESMDEYSALDPDQQKELGASFEGQCRRIQEAGLIAVIRDTVNRFEEKEYQHLLNQMSKWAQPATTGGGEPGSGNVVKETEGIYIAARTIHVPFDKPYLDNEDDVSRYVDAVREAYLPAIREGKRVRI